VWFFDSWVDFIKSSCVFWVGSNAAAAKWLRDVTADNLSSETVKGLSLTLQGVDDIHGGDSLTAGVLSVGNRVTDDVLKEDLEDTTGLFVDETGDTLDTTTTSETADSGLGDTLDVIAKDLAVTLGTSLSETFGSFSSSGHVGVFYGSWE
jgi:hypothetical protein